MTTNTGNYREEPPDRYDGTKEKWLNLSYSGQYYHYSPEDQQEYNKNFREETKEWTQDLKSNSSCSNCEESHSATLVFHHVDEKNHTIGEMISNRHSIESVKNELSNCVLLCANCHRKHHAGDLNTSNFERVF